MLLKILKVIKNLMIVFVLVLIGCGTTTVQFVVLRDVPEDPSFVVFPATSYLSEAAYANRIERALIASGAKVVRQPVLGADTQADYIVQTYWTSEQVKISKKATGEILTVLVVPEFSIDPTLSMPAQKQIISDALLHMGILSIN